MTLAHRTPAVRLRRLTTAIMCVTSFVGAIGGSAADAAPRAVSPATAGVRCDPLRPTASATTTVVTGLFPGIAPPDAAVRAFRITGLDPATCDGSTAQLTINGNPSGNPSAPADLLLATTDSTLNPCTLRPLPAPARIAGGTITFEMCPAGGPAGYVDVREVTALSLVVAGAPVPVGLPGPTGQPGPAGTTTMTGGSGPVPGGTTPTTAAGTTSPGSGSTRPPTSAPTRVLGVVLSPRPRSPDRSVGSLTGLLPLTGSDVGLAAWAGMLAIVLGLSLACVVRRRRS